MDSYTQHGATGWTPAHSKISQHILQDVIRLIRRAKYCDYNRDRVTLEDGFLQFRLGIPDRIGIFTFFVKVYCCIATNRFALEVGFNQDMYKKHPVWMLLGSSNVVSGTLLDKAWFRCLDEI